MNLSPVQRRALRKLKSAWQDRNTLGERRSTLDALVDRKLANRSLAEDYTGYFPDNLWRITPAGTAKLKAMDFTL